MVKQQFPAVRSTPGSGRSKLRIDVLLTFRLWPIQDIRTRSWLTMSVRSDTDYYTAVGFEIF
jgi:hypothetical protein